MYTIFYVNCLCDEPYVYCLFKFKVFYHVFFKKEKEMQSLRNDGRDTYEFDKLFDEKCEKLGLTCKKCSTPLRNAHLIEVCKHVFCKACLDNVQYCPSCGIEFQAKHVIKDIITRHGRN